MAIARSETSRSGVPVVTIGPTRGWQTLNLGEIWSSREVLYYLAWRDIKVRYKQTVLGAAWAILQPLLSMLIFTLLLSRWAKIPSDGIPYPLFSYTGLLLWMFFANAVTGSANSLIENTDLVTKVYFPRLLIPGGAVASVLVDFGIALCLLIGLMLYYGVKWSWQIALAPVFAGLTLLLALGFGLWLSALNVKYRDFRYALPFVIQIWMFATPVVYPLSLVPEHWRWIMSFNPLTGAIEGFRAVMLGGPIHWQAVWISAVLAGGILLYAGFAFKRMERTFADLI